MEVNVTLRQGRIQKFFEGGGVSKYFGWTEKFIGGFEIFS